MLLWMMAMLSLSLFVVQALHANVWLAENWKSNTSFNIYDHSLERTYPPPNPNQPPKRIKQAFTLVGFSTSVYYHWMMNAVPRLVAGLPLLEQHPTMSILIPKMKRGKKHFIQQTMNVIFRKDAASYQHRLVEYDVSARPGVRLRRLHSIDIYKNLPVCIPLEHSNFPPFLLYLLYFIFMYYTGTVPS